MAPKKKFQTPTSGRTKWASWVIDHATGAGWPCAAGRSMSVTSPCPNMRGWNCRTASTIQMHPSTIWTMRARCILRCAGDPDALGSRVLRLG